MKNIDALLTRIAQEELLIETLETRFSDRLDFHDLAVWQLREALKAAYEAGRESAEKRTKRTQQ
jgi:hypothetical protein